MRLHKAAEFFIVTAAALTGALSVSCTKPSGDSSEDYNSSFSASPKVLKAGADGGEFTVEYGISGPMEGAVAEVTADSPWIQVRSVYNSEFICAVDPNGTGQDRTGKIRLGCSRTRPLEIMVIQSAGGGQTPIYSNYKIEVSGITTSTCRVKVTPVDAGKTYIWTPVRKIDYEKGTPADHIRSCIEQVEGWAVQLGSTPDKFLSSGNLDTDLLSASQRPSLFDRTDYYLTVFDISYDKATKKFSYSGKIDLLKFRTLSAPSSDMKFEILYSDGAVTVRPSKSDKYIFNYVSKDAWDSVDPDYAAHYYISYFSTSGSLETHSDTYRVDLTKDSTMERGKKYVAFAAGYRDSADDGGLTTEVNYIEFTY